MPYGHLPVKNFNIIKYEYQYCCVGNYITVSIGFRTQLPKYNAERYLFYRRRLEHVSECSFLNTFALVIVHGWSAYDNTRIIIVLFPLTVRGTRGMRIRDAGPRKGRRCANKTLDGRPYRTTIIIVKIIKRLL